MTGFEPNYTFTVTSSGNTYTAMSPNNVTYYNNGNTFTTVSTNPIGQGIVYYRIVSSPNFNTTVSATNYTMTGGGGLGNFNPSHSVTTRVATIGSISNPSSVTQMERNSPFSTTASWTGFEANYSFTVTSPTTGSISNNGSSWVSSGSTTTITTNSSGAATIYYQLTSSNSFSTGVTLGSYSISGGGNSSTKTPTWTLTTRAADTTANAFSFTSVTGQEPSIIATSDQITVTGLEPNYSVTVTASNGLVDAGTSTLSGTFAASKTVTTSASGTIVLKAQVGTGNFASATTATITVAGGTQGPFSAATRYANKNGALTSPAQVTNAALSTVYTSAVSLFTFLEPNFTFQVSVANGQVSADGSNFASSVAMTTNASGEANIYFRLTSSSSSNTSVSPGTLTLSNGGPNQAVTPLWSVTTALDTTADPFSFTSSTNVNPSSTNTSNTVTITGLSPNNSVTVTISGGLANVDAGTTALSGSYAASKTVTTSASGTIVVRAQATASSNFNTSRDVTITVAGNTSGTYTIITRNPIMVGTLTDPANRTNANRSVSYISAAATITGLEPSTLYRFDAISSNRLFNSSSSASGFSNPRGFTSNSSGNITFYMRFPSSSNYGTAESFGNFDLIWNWGASNSVSQRYTSNWTVTTIALDDTANAFSWVSRTNQELSTTVTSTTITVGGLTPGGAFAVTASNGLVDAGTLTLSGTFAASKLFSTNASGTFVMAAQLVTSASTSTTTTVTITVSGKTSGTFSATTKSN
jgi:hypothetical protein